MEPSTSVEQRRPSTGSKRGFDNGKSVAKPLRASSLDYKEPKGIKENDGLETQSQNVNRATKQMPASKKGELDDEASHSKSLIANFEASTEQIPVRQMTLLSLGKPLR